jgi:dolichol-phosphate mannosyltransferase
VADAPHGTSAPGAGSRVPDLSLVIPCYNEQDNVGYTIPRLVSAFEKGGRRLEVIAVDNGSTDGTAAELARLAAAHPGAVVPVRVEINQGYGFGILSGIPHARAAWIGTIPADGQVDAEDVVRLFDAVEAHKGPVLGKVRRRFRMDGFRRKVISIVYNLFVRILWPSLASLDVNGVPKILPREVLRGMGLRSANWLLDAEIMIKAHYMGLQVLELNVFARMRSRGISHVKGATIWEFVRSLLMFRFSPEWRRELKRPALDRRAAQVDAP